MRHLSIALSSVLLLIVGTLGLSSEISALTYPVGVPTGEIAGGTYRTYFDNIFPGCSAGQVIQSFSAVGVPVCVTPTATGFSILGAALGHTLYYNGSNWVSSTNIFNSGGNVGIGTTTPGAKLEINGQIKITGGTPGAGQVLTSDATGLATWVTPGAASNQVCPGTGLNNTCYGIGAMNVNTSGYSNVSLGTNSLFSNVSGYSNTAIGMLAGSNLTSGNNNIFIGYNSQPTAASVSNRLNIGNWIYGSGGDIGIGYTSPRAALDVKGEIVGLNRLTLTTDGGNTSPTWHIDNHGTGAQDRFRIFRQPNIDTVGSEFLTVLSGGNIGIGTQTPGAKLEINGQIKITGGTPGAGQVLTSDATGLATWAPVTAGSVYATGILGGVQNYITKFGTGGNGLYPSQLFDNGVNIGIGTATPAAKIDIPGTGSTPLLKIGGVTISSVAGTDLVLRNLNQLRFQDGNDWDWNKWAGIKYDSTNEKLIIGGPASSYFNSNTSPPALDVLFDGVNNVGIGTTTPAFKLDVSNDASFNGVRVGRGSGSILSNTAVGYQALLSNTMSGTSNTAIGYRTLSANTLGDSNTAIGYGTLYRNTLGSYNTAIGTSSLGSNLEGGANTAVGYAALASNLSGDANTAIGNSTLRYSITGSDNTANGYAALRYNILGYSNTANGRLSLALNLTGHNNLAEGDTAGYSNITGNSNVAVGVGSLNNTTLILSTGSINASTTTRVTLSQALPGVVAGDYVTISATGNTISGLIALMQVVNSTTLQIPSGFPNLGTSGTAVIQKIFRIDATDRDNMVALGYNAGAISAGGSGTILIGANVNAPDANAQNQLNIGNWIYGNGGNIGIGVLNPGAKLEVAGQIKITGGTPGAGKVLTSDATGLATWKTVTAGSVYATGILGGVQNYVTKFGTGGNGLYPSNIFDNGTNVGIGTTTPAFKLDVSDDASFNGVRVGRGPGDQYNNTILGFQALQNNTASGAANTAVGYRSLYSNTTGLRNTANGVSTLLSNTTGNNNTANGLNVLYSNTTGNNNTANGVNALFANTIGYNNTANGVSALYSNITGVNNTAIGVAVLYSNTTGIQNTANGVESLNHNTTGNANTAMGRYAGSTLSATGNTYMGYGAGNTNVSSGYGTGITTASTTSRITISPALSLVTNPIGTVVYMDFTGSTISGLREGLYTVINATTLQVLPDYGATFGTTGTAEIERITKVNPALGDYRTIIGYNAGTSNGGGDNSILIGNAVQAVSSAANQLNIGNWIYGNGGNIGIGVLNPGAKLDVLGGDIRTNGELISTNANQARFISGNYGIIHRNDGTNYYMLLTASGDQYGSWNALRPLTMNTASGHVNIGNNALFVQHAGNVGIGTTSPSAKLEVAGQVKITGGTPGLGKVLTSDANGLATWSSILSGATATGIVGGTQNYVPKFGTGGTGLYSSQLFDNGTNIGIGTSSPSYKLDVYGNGRFNGNLTVSGSLIVDKLVNRTVNNISISGSILPDAMAPLTYRDIGSNAQRWNNLYLSGQVTIAGGSPGLGKILMSDANGLATWTNSISGATATGITGGSGNYIPKFGTGGTGLYSSVIYQNGTNIAIGTGTATAKLTLDSGLANISGIRLTRLTATSPTYTGTAVGIGIDSSGNLVPVSNGDVVVYDGIGRNGTTPSPNPDVPNREISYDFNKYFLIPTKQSFVVSDGNGAGYNAPYFKEDGVSGLCSWNGAGGTSPYDCGTADPYTGLSASPNNSFTMTARGTSYGYQIALGARGDAPLFARSGKWYNSTSNYGSGLYLSDGVTPTPWQKVLTVPANHIEYFYVNIGYNSQLQAISGGGNIGMGTSTPDMRLVLAYSGSTGSTSEMMRIERGLKGADANMITTFGTPYLLIGGKETRANSIQTIGFGYNSASSYQPAEIGLVTTNTAGNTQGDLVFATRSGTTNVTPTERMRIFGNGSIGIGTSTVASRFEVWSGATTIFHMRGTNNIGMGIGSVRSLLSGNANTGFGNESLYTLTTGYSNSAFGHQALRQSTTGYNNSAFGKEAMYNDGDGTWNTALGYQALRSASSSDYNVAIGGQTLYTLGTGTGNIAIGHNALYGATTSTSNNIAIGYQAGSGITTGWNNIVIGNAAQALTSTGSNQLNIGNWIYGKDGNIGIGITLPRSTFDINGAIVVRDRITLTSDTGTTTPTWHIDNSGSLDRFRIYRQPNISTLGSEFLTVLSGGNIGIGTPSPFAKLSVAGVFGIGETGSTGNRFLISTNASGAVLNQNDNSPIYFQTQGNNQLTILNNGNVGIGTTTPSAKLDVNGTFKLGTAGTATTAAGTCTIAASVITTTAVAKTCTGVPASTAVAVNCSAAAAFTTPGTTALYCRASGVANSVTCNTTLANAVSTTYTCMWMQ